MHDFAVEDYLYQPTYKKVSIGVLVNIENQKMIEDVSPHKSCLQKIAF